MTDAPRRVADAWLPFVLDEGQPASAEGVIVQLRQRLVVLADDGVLAECDDGTVTASLAVDLQLPPTLTVESLLDRDVVATGRLERRRLVIETDTAFTSRVGTTQRPPRPVYSGDTAGTPRLRPRLRPAVERALMQDGILLDLWQPDRAAERCIALATDVEIVTRALSPTYPDLEVIHSIRTEAALQEIQSLFITNDLVMAFGRDHAPDGQMRVAVTLLHLPSALATRLTAVPTDALALRVLLKPR